MLPNRKRLYRNSIVIDSDSESDDLVDLTSASPTIDSSLESLTENRMFERRKDELGSNFGYVVGALDGTLEFDESPMKKRRGSNVFSTKGCQEIIIDEIENMNVMDAVDYLKKVLLCLSCIFDF